MGTVVKAYALLENLGHLDVRSQSGFYVRPHVVIEYPLPHIARPMACPSYVGVSDLAAEVMTSSAAPANVSLGWGIPDIANYPNRRIARMLASVVRDDPDWLARSALNWGYAPLAREIARHYVHDGISVSHHEVLVTTGCIEALNLGIRAVAKPGETIAVATPASFGLLQILQSLAIRVLEIPSCPTNGILLDQLRTALRDYKIAAVILMPNYQYPLGCLMTDERKAALYRLLQEFDTPVVEDDVYGELYYGDRRPKPLKAWDVDGRVILCGSFTKVLAPGLRVGWCAAGRYLEPVRRLKMANTMGTPLILQKIICDFLRMGGYDRLLRSLRRIYARNLSLYAQAIRRSCPAGTCLSRPEGGFVLWVQFPKSVDTVRLFHEALEHDVSVAPGILFSVQQRYNNCVSVNVSSPWSDRIQAALNLLGELAHAQLTPKFRRPAARKSA